MTPHKDTQFQILFPHPIHKVVKNKLANNLKIKLNVSFYDSVGELKKIYNNTNVDIIFLEERLLDELSIQEKKDFNFGKKPAGVIVDDFEAVNIDRYIDFDLAELISKKYNKY